MPTMRQQPAVQELLKLKTLCDEGRQIFSAAARRADDILGRAVYLYQARRCRDMMDELQSHLERHGGAGQIASGVAPLKDESLSEKAALVRCLNWQSAALQSYDLALRRGGLPEEDRILLTHHRQCLEDALQHLSPHLSAATPVAA